MKHRLTASITCAGCLVLLGCDQDARNDVMDALIDSLDLDPAVELNIDCPPVPSDAQPVSLAATFVNQPPIRPGSEGYPRDFCPVDTEFYALAEGSGNSLPFGKFKWRERYCALSTAAMQVEGAFMRENGEQLQWNARTQGVTDSPEPAAAKFSGEITFTGGTGPFVGATGRAVVAAAPLGDANSEHPAGSTAVAVCGWIKDKAG